MTGLTAFVVKLQFNITSWPIMYVWKKKKHVSPPSQTCTTFVFRPWQGYESFKTSHQRFGNILLSRYQIQHKKCCFSSVWNAALVAYTRFSVCCLHYETASPWSQVHSLQTHCTVQSSSVQFEVLTLFHSNFNVTAHKRIWCCPIHLPMI